MKKAFGLALFVLGGIAVCLGIALKIKNGVSVSVIGSSDGPTSVFLAGKVGGSSVVGMTAAGAISMILGICLLWNRK